MRTGEVEAAIRELRTEVVQRRQAEEALRLQRNLFEGIIGHVPFAVYWKDRNSVYLGCNDDFARRAGVAGPAEIVGKTDYDLSWGEGEAAFYQRQDRQIIESGEPLLDAEENQTRRDGTTMVLLKSKVPLRSPAGEIVGVLGIFADITGRKRLEEDLQRSRKRMEEAQRIARFGHWEWTVQTGELYWSNAIYDLFDLDPAQITPSYELFAAHVHPDDLDRVESALQRALRGEEDYDIEHRMILPDGDVCHIHERGEVVRDAAGASVIMVGTAQDITAQRAAEAKLREQACHLDYLARHDTLTGLANRALFQDHVAHACGMARRCGQQIAVLVLDLDRFKTLNDTLGQTVGDEVLQAVAERLRRLLRETDTVARMGGDEFAVLIEDLAPNEGVGPVATVGQKILEAVARPIRVQEHEFYLSASIGVALFPEDAQGAETLLQCADVAMDRARRRGGNLCQFYTNDMDARARELLLLESDLRRAIDQHQLTVFYQPQVDLISEWVVGFEALVRWRHPEKGMVSPADFVPLAEETGLIVPLGEEVLRQACAQNRAWQQAGHPPVTVAVNISARQFSQPNLVEMVERVLRETGLDPGWLELEITESAIMESVAEAVGTLSRLKAQGIRLSIDDFGTGYSSLSYLRRFPVDKLKIDQSFIRHVISDAGDAALASSIIALAQSMKLKVVAEGIETREQLHFLLHKGCGEGQGFLFSRPLPPEDLNPFLGARTAPARRADPFH